MGSAVGGQPLKKYFCRTTRVCSYCRTYRFCILIGCVAFFLYNAATYICHFPDETVCRKYPPQPSRQLPRRSPAAAYGRLPGMRLPRGCASVGQGRGGVLSPLRTQTLQGGQASFFGPARLCGGFADFDGVCLRYDVYRGRDTGCGIRPFAA